MYSGVYKGRRVLITGHTGFKGSWLATWLMRLGAEVGGLSLDTPSTPSNFEILGLQKRLRHYVGDVRDYRRVAEVMQEFRPEMVFHLAAQALVRRSYADPVATFTTNAMGSLNVLEGIRHCPEVRAAVMITSDKCYRNVEWTWGYRENDMLGGEDPYSASKGCAELIAYSYLNSYFKPEAGGAFVATARAGNVIGGGDWAEDRIVPDCMRSWSKGTAVVVRSPQSTRPWQHVIEPLSGYLHLGGELWRRNQAVAGQSYNFGPDATVNQPVITLIKALGSYWPNAQCAVESRGPATKPEARLLKLCCDKALAELNWKAVLTFEETVQLTGEWYQHYYQKRDADMHAVTMGQLDAYCGHAKARGLGWA
ncbi:MAG TPA: CDP-glucose 4,6-dehydratase [Lacunisphaera sp.]|nr:CDP-glucose 4,6-dehydratase [Lacunisphaera sp.]